MSVDNSARSVLWYLSFVGFAITSSIRVNLNIALVAMVQQRPAQGNLESECYIRQPINATLMNNDTTAMTEKGFLWNEHEQGLILGSFYWLHWTTSLPGGILAQTYGGKKIFGLMTLLSVLICFITPMSAYHSIHTLIIVRCIQGVIAGFAWPAMHNLIGLWIPPNERSTFTSCYSGVSVGCAIMLPLCGYLIDWFGWESVFHISGTLGVLWFIAWHFLAFDSPSDHPRISQEEREYIFKSLNTSSKQEKLETPWKSIALSLPLWIITFAMWSAFWGAQTLMIQLPSYLLYVHGLNIRSTGLLSGIPHGATALTGYLSAAYADYLLRNNKLSRTNVRKLLATICLLGQAVFFVGVVLSGCNSAAVMVMIVLTSACQGALFSAFLAAVVDIAPNFAGILFGLANMVTSTGGFVSSAVVGALTYNNQTAAQWNQVLLISAGIAAFPCFIFVAFLKLEVQKWNYPKKDGEAEELEPMREIQCVKKESV